MLDFVGIGNSPYVELYVTFFVSEVTDPPFALNVSVYVFGVHCAINVWSDAVDTFVVSVIIVVFNFHPSNV